MATQWGAWVTNIDFINPNSEVSAQNLGYKLAAM